MLKTFGNPGRQRRALRAVLIGFPILAVILVLVGILQVRMFARRYPSYGIYLNALRAYYDLHGTQPGSITDIEACYNDSQFKLTDLPMPSPAQRPSLRTPWPADGDEYLILVEPEPAEWYVRYRRFVTFAREDETGLHPSESGTRTVWWWDLDDLIAEDEAKRARKRLVNEPVP